MTVGSTRKFRARFLIEEEHQEVEVWDDEFTPFEEGKRSVREWVHSHFCESYTHEDLRELLGVSKEGNFEVLVEGTIRGTYCEWTQEYDEELDILKVEHQKIPGWYEMWEESNKKAVEEQEQRIGDFVPADQIEDYYKMWYCPKSPDGYHEYILGVSYQSNACKFCEAPMPKMKEEAQKNAKD